MLRQLSILMGREIEALFVSPISYAVLTIALLLNGWSFYMALFLSAGNVGQAVRVFFGASLLFWFVVLLVPPLFTMRAFADERRSGTIEMLLTAPVGESEVVLAKFFAGLLFYLSLWLPSLLYLAIVKSYGAIPEIGPLFTAYVGIILLGSLFTAVGLFASSLTANQILAAVLATVFNLLIFFVPSLSLFTEVDQVERFLKELWILQHFSDSFSKGLLDSAHLAYYLILTGVFLFWTVRVVESQRWR
jgi:ABC-2 type transport system permease protein